MGLLQANIWQRHCQNGSNIILLSGKELIVRKQYYMGEEHGNKKRDTENSDGLLEILYSYVYKVNLSIKIYTIT